MKTKLLSVFLAFVAVTGLLFPIAATANSTGSGIEGQKIPDFIDPQYIQTAKVDPIYAEWLFSADEDILSGSTSELLDYFLESPFLKQQVYSCASTPSTSERYVDFSCNECFSELITRDDFVAVLEEYAKNIYSSAKNTPADSMASLKAVLDQIPVKALVEKSRSICPMLDSIYSSSEVESATRGSYVGTIGDIDYYSAGYITTASGNRVDVCTPERALTSSEISSINAAYNYSGNTRIGSPSATYNCHSYAWYQYNTANPYWINSIGNFLSDGVCARVSSAQVKDIIVYVDANGYVLHSGVVASISSGNITVCSKWGQAGVYMHAISNVPTGYMSHPDEGGVSYALFRYHDYSNQYTGNEYHAGTYHYFEYADVCSICANQRNNTWTKVACDGPPCIVPFNLRDDAAIIENQDQHE